jgi:hypothetical protein
MADSDDSLSDSSIDVKKQRRVYDTKKKSTEVLSRYYASPEKQKKLQERIKLYEDNIQHLTEKITHLRQFVLTDKQ